MHSAVHFKNPVPAVVLPTEFRTLELPRAPNADEDPHFDDATNYGSLSGIQDLYEASEE